MNKILERIKIWLSGPPRRAGQKILFKDSALSAIRFSVVFSVFVAVVGFVAAASVVAVVDPPVERDIILILINYLIIIIVVIFLTSFAFEAARFCWYNFKSRRRSQ